MAGSCPAEQLLAVHELNAAGLCLAQRAQFGAAQEYFANNIVDLSPFDGVATSLARATAWRDSGFTYARQVVMQGEPGQFGPTDQTVLTDATPEQYAHTAMGHLEQARRVTKPYVIGARMPHDGPQCNLVTKHTRAELISSHAATISCMARVGVAAQVYRNEIPLRGRAGSDVVTAQWRFGIAHSLARTGNNAYITVSNAMHAARAERMNGRVLNVPSWLGRAAMGVVRGALTARRGEDFKNVARGLRTAARLIPDVVSRKRAFRSARMWNMI